MPNIFHQSVEDILKAATPEQKIAWNNIFLRFSDRCAISQFCYSGVAASELSTYVARKIYLPYLLEFGSTAGAVLATGSYMMLFDENNVQKASYNNNAIAWDATAAAMRYSTNTLILQLNYFSKLQIVGGSTYINFIGYRITY